MVNHLYALGCSWTEGTDDEEQLNGWVGRLSSQLNCSFTNLGGKGDSNWQQYQQFIQQPIHENSFAIFGLSAISRTVGKNGTTLYGGDFDKQYMMKYYNEDFIKFQTNILIHSFQQYCYAKNIPNLTFISFDDKSLFNERYDFINYEDVITSTTMREHIAGDKNMCGDVAESTKFIQKLFGRQSVPNKVNLNYFSRDGHPNANGYKMWSEFLYNKTMLYK